MKFKRMLFRLMFAISMMLLCTTFVCASDVISYGSCGDELTYTLDSNGILTITGQGEMEWYDGYDYISPWQNDTSIKQVVIENGVSTISECAFSNCSNLTSVSIPDSVFWIGSLAFENCTNLTSVVLPKGLEYFEMLIFSGCTSLTDITVSSENDIYYSENGILFMRDEAGNSLVYYPAGKTDTSYQIPENVINISSGAFSNEHLEKITLPSSMTHLEPIVFLQCLKLSNIDVAFGNEVFYSDNGVLFMKDSAETILVCYPGGKTDTSYDVPKNVTTITYGSVVNQHLKSISIYENVSNIATLSIVCPNLESIDVSDKNMSYLSVDGVLFNKDKSSILLHPACKEEESYEIPFGVNRLYAGCFLGSTAKEIIIPNTVTCISSLSFSDMSNLTDIYYQGTETEWADICHDGLAEFLINVTVHCENIPNKLKLMNMQIIDIDNPSMTASFSVDVKTTGLDVSDNMVCYVARYNTDGKLCEVKEILIGSNDTQTVYYHNVDNFGIIEVFVWDNKTLKPLYNSSSIDYGYLD